MQTALDSPSPVCPTFFYCSVTWQPSPSIVSLHPSLNTSLRVLTPIALWPKMESYRSTLSITKTDQFHKISCGWLIHFSLSSRWVVLVIIMFYPAVLEFELIGLFSESSVFQEGNVFWCPFYVFLLLTLFTLTNKNKLTGWIKVCAHSYVWLLYLMGIMGLMKIPNIILSFLWVKLLRRRL